MKKTNNEFNNKIEIYIEQINKLKLELQNNKSNNNININNNNLFDLIRPLAPGENIMTVNFNSLGTQLVCNVSLACKKTNLFVRLEEILNNKFLELKKYETYFEVNGKRIKRFQTLEENRISDNDMINIFLIDS